MIGIYKITNPLGLIYIGQSKNLNNRFLNYRYTNKNYKSAIRESLKKYGYNNHKFEVLEECDINDLNKLEIKYIKLYDSFKNGLNCTSGGIKQYQTDSETYKKISTLLKGKKRPDYVIDKIKETKRNNPIIVSNDTKLKMSLKAKGNKSHCKKVKVTIGFYHAIYNSLNESSKELRLTRARLSKFVNNHETHRDFKIEYI
jgi:group I intron endonuclease